MPWSKREKARLKFLNQSDTFSKEEAFHEMRRENTDAKGREALKKQDKEERHKKTSYDDHVSDNDNNNKDGNNDEINLDSNEAPLPMRRRRSSFSSMNEDVSISELRKRRNSFESVLAKEETSFDPVNTKDNDATAITQKLPEIHTREDK